MHDVCVTGYAILLKITYADKNKIVKSYQGLLN